MAEALVELLSEEIPARMQSNAGQRLKQMLEDGLKAVGVCCDCEIYTGPRRLTAILRDIPVATDSRVEEKRGPRVGAAEKAIQGFLRATNKPDVSALEIRDTGKGDFYFAVNTLPGESIGDVLVKLVDDIVTKFSWPVSMRWGDGDLRWIRPLHQITVRLWQDGVEHEVGGGKLPISYNKHSIGHRVHAPGAVSYGQISDYARKLRHAYVEVDPASRRDRILNGLHDAERRFELQLVDDQALLEEVVGLAEWPVVLVGSIDAQFQNLPSEVLATSMRVHQKYFSLANSDGVITHFAMVVNIEARDGGVEVQRGNERVLAARLSDAAYFFAQDKAVGLDNMGKKLENVTFHEKLGSLQNRVQRINKIGHKLCHLLDADPALFEQASWLCKADLMSGMVAEFPELQGVMGGYYAQELGVVDEVSEAIAQQYFPVGQNDFVPTGKIAVILGLADRLDILAGFWSIDEKPTGSKDPYALRRAAISCLRILHVHQISVSLRQLIELALSVQSNIDDNAFQAARDDLLAFFRERGRVILRDRGSRHDVVDAMLSHDEFDFAVAAKKAEILQEFLMQGGHQLIAPFKRANNIIKQLQISKTSLAISAVEPAEIGLQNMLENIKTVLSKATSFDQELMCLREIAPPLEQFFDELVVNHEDEAIKQRRLALLGQVTAVFLQVVNFEELED